MSDPLSFLGTAIATGVKAFGDWQSNQAGLDAANKNLALQRENLDWQKQMQAESWKRDDTAVQRRAADMAAAGFNPLLAAGNAAGSSPVVSTRAPQLDTKYVRGASVGGLMSLAGNSAIESLSMAKDFAVKDAQAQLLHAQAGVADADAEYKRAITPGASGLQESQTGLNIVNADVMKANNMFKLAELDEFKRRAEKTVEIGIRALASDEDRIKFEQEYNFARREAGEAMAKAHVDKEVADSLSSLYASEVAKANSDVAKSTVPAHIAGAYADVANKLTGSVQNMSFSGWLRDFLAKKPAALER